ncbi:PREDICTED: structural maintenance of chromosomes protein 1-like [Populus euphratica]|uniref:Structural maintenance of chromosomes protein 1-like n=1 Tax=Populus euphratica TaxID=75702 RepID=A0AAJ6UF37_POPEU|nr:PREDICTED: structural maintenance of chromosomes protein 1-like [Populus euphratica]XP_011028807.1 PREDICTED: structural maintenance of chromosomes protein 1-like [Populus euphratica]
MDGLISEIEKNAPSLKALYQYEALREKEKVVTEEFEAARMEEKQIADGYNAVKQRRGLIQLVNLVKPSTLCTKILHLI